MIKKLFTFFVLFLLSFSISGQEALKSIEEEYYDFLSLTGVTERPTFGYRTLSDNLWKFNDEVSSEEAETTNTHIWSNNNLGTTFTLWEASSPVENGFTRGINQVITVRIFGPEWFNSYNSDVPFGQNDGALWQGRGYNTSLTAGVRFEGYGVEATFKPQVSWMQNREFETNPDVYPNPYSYSFKNGKVHQRIDYVRRYGNSSLWNFDLNDTEIRYSWKNLTIGFGSQNPWLGPAYLNPMLGSNNAPGYLKLDIGIRKTELIIPKIDFSLGFFELRLWTGQLKESDFFDEIEWNDKRMLNGLSLSYSPSFVPGFTIGLNRIFMTYWKYENFKYIPRLFAFDDNNALASSGNDEDQKFAAFIEWNFKKIGFCVYGELGRDDFTSNMFTNPFHTAIYTVGVKQIIPLPFGLQSIIYLEWNNFEMSQDFQLQWPYLGYYGHGFVKQGYTHKGQIIGAGSGALGNSQLIQYKVYYPKGFTSFKYHRYCPNNNSVYSQAVYTKMDNDKSNSVSDWYACFETYLTFELQTNYFITSNIDTELHVTYMYVDKINYEDIDLHSFSVQILFKYLF